MSRSYFRFVATLISVLALAPCRSAAETNNACPAKIGGLSPIARSADDSTFLYLLHLKRVSSDVRSFRAELNDASGRLVAHIVATNLVWQQAGPNDATDFANVMFSWRELTNDIALTDVTTASGDIAKCAPVASEDPVLPISPDDITVMSNIPRIPPGKAVNATAEDFIDAQFLLRVQADYPIKARDNNLEGTVRLYVLVGTDGLPHKVRILRSSGLAEFDASASQALMASTFSPAVFRGKRIQLTYRVVYEFRLTP